ncbi:hypothetical protein MLD38_028361 [Melastoma candidum]|uniref:Uncharacterized protein n=1 Tax=Melastoma candidum TaxID=119954 RepID=A0ACB9N356_9MYRT|nr:hypothetical protein MLD38_028361 [Melastoma candidum]
MDFFRIRKFRRSSNLSLDQGSEEMPVPPLPDGDQKSDAGGNIPSKSPVSEDNVEDDDDEDFIANEVKRRLKELRRNSFLMLIPEEDSCAEEDDDDDEEGEMNCGDCQDVGVQGRQWWAGFDAFYEKYCERMLFFDRLSAQLLNEAGSHALTAPSLKSASKKLASPFRCLSLARTEDPDEDMQRLQQSDNSPYLDLETAYIAQSCLTWEALHSQYTQLRQKTSIQPGRTCYNHSAQQFEHFHVLLQRFIENEPFEDGLRPETYARARKLLPKLLQVPLVRGSEQIETEKEGGGGPDFTVLALDLVRLMESIILTFYVFLRRDKKKQSAILKIFGNQNHIASPLQQVQSSLEKKATRLKELRKKRKGWKTKTWPRTYDDADLLLGLVDVKIVSMVLRSERITKEQLTWCEEKMKKLELADWKLCRDPSPLLFPC